MARETSIEAYNKIVENGLLSKRRLQVYQILYERGPMTGAQVAEAHRIRHGITAESETIRNRLTELREQGVVKETGDTVDPATKMRVLVWDVTAGLPRKIEKKPTKREIIDGMTRRIAELELKILHLTAEVRNLTLGAGTPR